LFRLRTSLPAQAVSNPVTDVAGFFYGCRSSVDDRTMDLLVE